MSQLNKVYDKNDKIAELTDGELNNIVGGWNWIKDEGSQKEGIVPWYGIENTSGKVIQENYLGTEFHVR